MGNTLAELHCPTQVISTRTYYMRILGGSAMPVNLWLCQKHAQSMQHRYDASVAQRRRQGLRRLDSREKESIMRHTSPRQEVTIRMADAPGSLPVWGGGHGARLQARASSSWPPLGACLTPPALRVDMMNYPLA
jgi:hypothetical protein